MQNQVNNELAQQDHVESSNLEQTCSTSDRQPVPSFEQQQQPLLASLQSQFYSMSMNDQPAIVSPTNLTSVPTSTLEQQLGLLQLQQMQLQQNLYYGQAGLGLLPLVSPTASSPDGPFFRAPSQSRLKSNESKSKIEIPTLTTAKADFAETISKRIRGEKR